MPPLIGATELRNRTARVMRRHRDYRHRLAGV
jgi:hypothetical protein